ncbi:MAG: hypothetical protein KAT68_03860 [Bacteroidales bacterium]|nr:hypothetical protein [Bacteroidales bacterium]
MKNLRTYRILFFSLFLSFILFIIGCGKKYEVEIVGNWEETPMTDKPVNTRVWTFYDDNSMKIEETADTVYKAEYSLEKKFNFHFVTISNLERGLLFNGKYRIDELKDGILKLQRVELENGESDGAYLRKEFIKL